MVRVGYKQTEVGEIPEDWNISEIKDISKTGSGTTPARSQHDKYYKSGVHCWVKTTDLNNSTIEYTEEKVSAIALSETCLQLYPENTVLVAMYGGFNQIGRTGILNIPAAVNQALVAIDVDRKILKPRLLLNLLNYRVSEWKKVASSSRKDPNITSTDVKCFKVVYPHSLFEQNLISKALSDVDELIVSLEKLIAKKRDIKTATMQQLLTGKKRLSGFGEGKGYKQTELGEIPEDWNIKGLGSVAKIEMGQSPSSSNYNTKGLGLPLIQGNADIKNRKTIIRNYTSQITKKAQSGEIILSVRAPVGEVSIAKFDCCIGRGVCAISYKNDYLYHWLVSFESSWEMYSKGSTFDSINSDELKDINMFLPYDENEQIAIASVLSGMDKEIAFV